MFLGAFSRKVLTDSELYNFKTAVKGLGLLSNNASYLIDRNFGLFKRCLEMIVPNNKFDNLYIEIFGEIYNSTYLYQKFNILECDKSIYELIYIVYKNCGINGFKVLDGKFLIILYDFENKKLYILRDRFGQMPFYYVVNEDIVYFSDNLPLLLKNTNNKKEYSRHAIHLYFSLQGVIPPPYTIFEDYKKLEHGSMMILQKMNNKLDLQIHHVISPYIQNDQLFNLPYKDIIKKTKDSLCNSIEKCFIDNPVIWLSGGIDSSLIVSILRYELGIKDLNTMSISFPSINKCYQNDNDYKFAHYVARRCNSKHIHIEPTMIDTIDVVCNFQAKMNEPMMSEDIAGQFLLSENSYKNNFYNVITGIGADEMWLGYSYYQNIVNEKAVALSLFKDVFLEREQEELKNILLPKFCEKNFTDEFLSQYFESIHNTELNKLIQSDINILMVDDPIKRMYNTTMFRGVNYKSPYLMNEMVSIAEMVPKTKKIKDNVGKYILRKILEEYFGYDFAMAPKRHFGIPYIRNTDGKIKFLCKNILMNPYSRIYDIVSYDFVGKLLSKELVLSKLSGNLLWQIVCLELWLKNLCI